MVRLGGNRLTCNNARRRPAAWKITMIIQSLLSKYAHNNRKLKPIHMTMKTIAFSTNLLWSPGLNIKVNYCLFFFFFFKAIRMPCYFVSFEDIILGPNFYYFNQHQPERKGVCQSVLRANLYLALQSSDIVALQLSQNTLGDRFKV